jgi:endonuclease/exonuclease/phosphatase family metal-dependent hydrolase
VRLAFLLLAAGCVSSTDDRGPWIPVESITGDFAPEVGPVPAPLPPRSSLHIATWNVHFGADPDGLARAIKASQEVSAADVIIVQEIQAYPDEPGSRAHRLADALGMTWVYAPARYYDTGTHGIAMLSRFPLEAVAVRQLPYVDQPLHPENRIALAADVVVGAQRFRLVDLHLDVRIAPVDRIRQLHPAVNELGELDRVVAGGDFNTNPWAWIDGIVPLTGTEAVIGQEQAAVVDDYLFGNGFAGAISPEQNTLRVPAFEFRCDDLYARGLPITASGVEHVDGSDHWPVWFDVAL